MDHLDFIVCSFKENYIGLKRVLFLSFDDHGQFYTILFHILSQFKRMENYLMGILKFHRDMVAL